MSIRTMKIRKAILYVFLVIFSIIVCFDIYRIMTFVKQGPRFTANDGQELCLRVQKLEADPKPCQYDKPRQQ